MTGAQRAALVSITVTGDGLDKMACQSIEAWCRDLLKEQPALLLWEGRESAIYEIGGIVGEGRPDEEWDAQSDNWIASNLVSLKLYEAYDNACVDTHINSPAIIDCQVAVPGGERAYYAELRRYDGSKGELLAFPNRKYRDEWVAGQYNHCYSAEYVARTHKALSFKTAKRRYGRCAIGHAYADCMELPCEVFECEDCLRLLHDGDRQKAFAADPDRYWKTPPGAV